MPRLPIDYANTIIYKIVCNDLNVTECYVGHTTDFVRRKRQHKFNSTYSKGKEFNTKLYKTIRDEGGFGNWCMIEIEKYPCKDVQEAKKKEREWIENINSKLITCYPQRTRTNQEYYIDNKNIILVLSPMFVCTLIIIKKKLMNVKDYTEYHIKKKIH
jgi:hypothetical protein